MRIRPDSSWRRYGNVVVAGSPLRLFRTTTSGAEVLHRIERGDEVAASRLLNRLLDAGAVHPVRSTSDSPRFTIDDVTVVTPQYGPIGINDERGAWRGHDDGRITVDDGSEPPLTAAIRRLPVNRGPAAARNAARDLVTTPLVAFLDVDVAVPGDHSAWLEPLLWHFDDPDIGLVAPRVTGEAGSPLDLGTAPARIRAGTRVSYVPGAAIVARASALDAIGWFDENLRVGEDVDLVWRLDQAGWRCRYDPAVEVWHEPRSSWSARLRQHATYGTSAAPLALRHDAAMAPVRLNGWTWAMWALLLSGHPAIGAATALGSAEALHRRLPALPRGAAWALAIRGHLAAGSQLAATARRVWWPVLAGASFVSRRARRLTLLSMAVNVRATPTDLAYGWGLWKGALRHRTAVPLIPRRPLRSAR